MAYTAITQEGKSFILNACKTPSSRVSKLGYDVFHGKSPDRINDPKDSNYNTDGHLPYCSPQISGDKIWYSSPKDDAGNLITTTDMLAENLIKWFDLYANQYQIDANIVAAQAYQESGYLLWNYPLTSTASGINQFTADTIFGFFGNGQQFSSEFTVGERNLITANLSGNLGIKDTFSVSAQLGKENRATLHQNIINNPKVMIKAQCIYLKYISGRCGGLASSTLFGYSRGPGLAKSSYTKSIQAASTSKYGANYYLEGVNYVYGIFNFLGNPKYSKLGYFGYDKEPHDLKLNQPYDTYAAEVEEGKHILSN